MSTLGEVPKSVISFLIMTRLVPCELGKVYRTNKHMMNIVKDMLKMVAKRFSLSILGDEKDGHFLFAAQIEHEETQLRGTCRYVYTFGNNSNGQVGDPKTWMSRSTPYLAFTSAPKTYVREIACGAYHSMILTTAGEVFSFGGNFCGQLGLQHIHKPDHRVERIEVTVPLKIDTLEANVVHIAAGGYHSVFVHADGGVSACGLAGAGQLGFLPQKGKGNQQIPKPVQGLPLKFRAVQASAGSHQTVVLGSNGSVYVWGCTDHVKAGCKYCNYCTAGRCQLCLPDHCPREIDGLEDQFAIQVAAANSMTAILCANGELYTAGVSIVYGEEMDRWSAEEADIHMGRSREHDMHCFHASPVDMGELWKQGHKVKHVAVGRKHTLMTTRSNKTVVFGHGKEGQLGNKSSKNVVDPTLLPSKLRTIRAACGEKHSAFITEEGRLLTCGENTYGQCGYDDDIQIHISIPNGGPDIIMSKACQRQVPCVTNVHLVACGETHTMLATSKEINHLV